MKENKILTRSLYLYFMKYACLLLTVWFASVNFSYSQPQTQNLIIVTTDGFRWQEVFRGMDSSIVKNERFNQGDKDGIYKKFWSDDPVERRSKLLPFFWSTIATKGQVYGNRNYGNYVNNANSYWFSYPGYSEIFCGYPDIKVNSNDYQPNPNTNVLEFINKQPQFKGKVNVFGAWEAFNRILNEKRSGIPVIAAFDNCGGENPDANERLINSMLKDSYRPFGEGECLDVFTHYAAMETLKEKKPKVLYVAYGETDEWAHSGFYKHYLEAAHQFDQWLKDLWTFVQNNPEYRNKTTILVTVDHGRGNGVQWTDHGSNIEGAGNIWFAVMGPDTPPLGEMKTPMQLYQKQFAQTIASFLGLHFSAEHPVAAAVSGVMK